jgi:hypothetical protein
MKMKGSGWAVFGALAASSVGWTVVVDWYLAAAWLHPVGICIAIAPAACAALLSLVPNYKSKSKARLAAWGSVLVCATVVMVPWNQRKLFIHKVLSIRLGSTVPEVETIMSRYFMGAGPGWDHASAFPPPLVRDVLDDKHDKNDELYAFGLRESGHIITNDWTTFSGTIVYRWTKESDGNADWGVVKYVNGKVVAAEFLAD